MSEHSARVDKPGRLAARQVLDRHQDELLAKPGVVGVGLGEADDGGWQLVVLVGELDGPSLPAALEGLPLAVRAIGQVNALDED
jgi:hypothetical protein